ncbi:MAG: GAF domain-containing protein [Sulfuricella sp.]
MNHASLRNQLIAAFVGLAVVPLLLAGALLGWHIYSVHLNDAYARQKMLAQSVAEQVTNFLGRFELALDDASSLSGFVTLDTDAQRHVMERLLAKQSAFREVWLWDDAGRERIHLSKYRLPHAAGYRDVTIENLFHETLKSGHNQFGPIYYDPTNSEPTLDMAMPLKDQRSGKTVGVLGAQLRIKAIWSLVSSVKTDKGELVYILDTKQRIIAHRNPSVVLREIRASLRPDQQQIGLDGEEVFVATYPVQLGQQTYTVVVERAVSVTRIPALTGVKIVGIVMVLALGVALAIFFTAMRRIVAPIQEIASTARAIRDGNLERQVAVRKKDEIGDLASSFNSMTVKLRSTLLDLESEIQERKQKEFELHKINQAYIALSMSNRAVIVARDETELFREICRIVIEECGYRLSWIGLAENDEEKTVRPVAQAGFEDGYLETLHLTWADTERGRGPTGTAIRERRAIINQDIHNNPAFAPWREQALKRGYASSAAFPLITGDQVWGALMVYAAAPSAFIEEEVRLLFELANNIAFGVAALHAEKERRHAAEVLRQERDFIGAVLNTAGTIIVVLDRHGHIVRFNRTAELLTGYSFDEVADQPFWENFLLPEEKAAVKDVFDNLAQGQMVARYENYWRMRDGSRRLFDWSNAVLLDRAGSINYIVSIGVDITERKRAEDALRELNASLEQRVREQTEENLLKERLLLQQSRHAAMGEMVSMIAHQWRQPLNSLAILLANIRDAFEFGELDKRGMSEFHDFGNRLIQRMSKTIDDFRNFFQPKLPDEFDVAREIRDTASLVEPSLRNNNIALEIQCEEGVQALGSANELGQVVLNLIVNAKEACLERKVADPRVTIKLFRHDGTARITVEDNAGGISPEIAERVFDPYFTTKSMGTGIGLYMSRIIIERHMGGNISFTNTGSGACFTLNFPLVPPPESKE